MCLVVDSNHPPSSGRAPGQDDQVVHGRSLPPVGDVPTFRRYLRSITAKPLPGFRHPSVRIANSRRPVPDSVSVRGLTASALLVVRLGGSRSLVRSCACRVVPVGGLVMKLHPDPGSSSPVWGGVSVPVDTTVARGLVRTQDVSAKILSDTAYAQVTVHKKVRQAGPCRRAIRQICAPKSCSMTTLH